MNKKQFGQYIIDSLRDHPENWRFDDYEATNGDLHLWIANRPYADLTVGHRGEKVGTFWQRIEIRMLMDHIRRLRWVASLAEERAKQTK